VITESKNTHTHTHTQREREREREREKCTYKKYIGEVLPNLSLRILWLQ
jgi:hypothetical protein